MMPLSAVPPAAGDAPYPRAQLQGQQRAQRQGQEGGRPPSRRAAAGAGQVVALHPLRRLLPR